MFTRVRPALFFILPLLLNSSCGQVSHRDQTRQSTPPAENTGDSLKSDSPPGRHGTDSSALTSFEGFDFAIPAGWSRVTPDRSKTKATILLNGTTWNNADGRLIVDVGKPSFPTAKQTAQALAGSEGVAISLDGHDGIRVSTASTDMSKPQHAIVVYRDDKVYLLMASGVRGTDVKTAFDYVARTWRWSHKP
jgi:hypothetical protein